MTTDSAPWAVRAAQRLEHSTSLDRVTRLVDGPANRLIAGSGRRYVLHGHWMGHALHPMLTDLPIGMWTSTNLLDLVGGKRSEAAADLLLATGIVAAVPTAVTGLAELAPIDEPEKRVGAVHAVANTAALGCYTASFLARRDGRRRKGVALALAGSIAATVGGFLGGHLTEARNVSSRHPAFIEDERTERPLQA